MGLALIFAYISLDELARLHELTFAPLRRGLNATGPFYFTWVVPGAAIVVVLFATYLRFLLDLPARTRVQFVFAGAMYVTGALGMEMVSGVMASGGGGESLAGSLVSAVEESLEMLGILVFNYALLRYLAASRVVVEFR